VNILWGKNNKMSLLMEFLTIKLENIHIVCIKKEKNLNKSYLLYDK